MCQIIPLAARTLSGYAWVTTNKYTEKITTYTLCIIGRQLWWLFLSGSLALSNLYVYLLCSDMVNKLLSLYVQHSQGSNFKMRDITVQCAHGLGLEVSQCLTLVYPQPKYATYQSRGSVPQSQAWISSAHSMFCWLPAAATSHNKMTLTDTVMYKQWLTCESFL